MNLQSSILRLFLFWTGIFFACTMPLCPLAAQESEVSKIVDSLSSEKSSPLTISLLFNTPLEDNIYTIYGHLAVRVLREEGNEDSVFNYGVFDFGTPNFFLNFITGHTDDYMLAEQPTSLYISNYLSNGCDIQELVLNLTPEEARQMEALLRDNLRPENVHYRYNFVFDNCSTRPVDLLHSIIKGRLFLPNDYPQYTRREMIDACNSKRPWLKLGTDIALGSTADKKVTAFEQAFLPTYLIEVLRNTEVIAEDGSIRPIVLKELHYPRSTAPLEIAKTPLFLQPEMVALILLFGLNLLLLSLRKKKYLRHRVSQIALILLTALQGTIGAIIFFLVFISIHPLTAPNWHLLAFNPILLFVGVPTFWKFVKSKFAQFLLGANILTQVIYIALLYFVGIQTYNIVLLLLSLLAIELSLILLLSNRNKRR